MNVDIAALRGIEREKDIPFDTLIETIETALLTAYRHTDGHQPHARIEIDRKTGEIRVMAQELDAEGEVVTEWDDTPEGFGRIAATTARQVILQRLRDAENERTFGDFAGREDDLITGTVTADAKANARGVVVVSLGDVEGVIPAAEQVPGESYVHGQRMRCYVVSVVRGHARHADHAVPDASRTWCASCSPWRCRRSPTAPWRSPLSPGRPGTGPRSRCGRPCPGSTPRAPASARWAAGAGGDERAERREDRHHRLRRRPGDVRRQCAVAGEGGVGHRRRPGAKAARVVVPDYQLSLAIGKEGQNARLAARLTGWRIDIRSDAAPAGPAAPDPDGRGRRRSAGHRRGRPRTP